MFMDQKRAEIHDELHRRDGALFAHILTPELFFQAARLCRLRLVRSPLNLINLVWLALSAARNPTLTFVALLGLPLNGLRDNQNFPCSELGRRIEAAKQQPRRTRPRRRRRQGRKSKRGPTPPRRKPSRHDPHGCAAEHVSEEAFAKARQKMPSEFWVALFVLLGERFESLYGEVLRWRHFRLLAIDGTRINLPDYPALRDHFGTPKNSTGKHNAQAQMVLLQFPLARLPCAYALDALAVGEVTLARRLLQGLSGRDLVLLDAGYLSYGLLWQIHFQGACFVVRLRKRLNASVIQELGCADDVLVRWSPKDSRGNWRKEDLPKGIVLRLLTYRVKGFRPLQLLSNVLSEQEVSHEEFWGLSLSEEGEVLTKGLYNYRWEIEVTYGELKLEQQLEGGLRGRRAEGIHYEVAGHVLYYLLLRWLLVEAAAKQGLSPLRLSFKAALAEVEQMAPAARAAEEPWLSEELRPRLQQRMASHVVPQRPARHYPRTQKERRASKQAADKRYQGKAAQKAKSGRQKKAKGRPWYGDGWDLGGPKSQPGMTAFAGDWDFG
jgi:hypothetical protein